MGVFRDLIDTARAILAGPQPTAETPAPAAAPRPRPRTAVDALARQLRAEFPDGIDAPTLWDRCEAAGLDMADVDRAIDEQTYAAERAAQVTPSKLDPAALAVVDLTGIDAVRMRIKGITYALHDNERARFGGTDYLLVREPNNAHDPHAIAVYGRGRRVGYVAASRAAALAPLLDSLEGDAFLVGGAVVTEGRTPRLWVDVPRVPALRAFTRPS